VNRLLLAAALSFACLLLPGCGVFSQSETPPITRAADPRHHTGDDGIVVLAAGWCGYCKQLEYDFGRAGVKYTRLDVDQPDGAAAAQAIGRRGVPQTIIGQRVISGYDMFRIRELLEPLGYRFE